MLRVFPVRQQTVVRADRDDEEPNAETPQPEPNQIGNQL